MNALEIIKDSEGKETLIKSKEELPDSKTIGQKLENFEILKLLGKGSFGKVYKVQSKLNKKIYAMKMIDLIEVKKKDNEKGDFYRLVFNEATLLNELSFPYIIKYYTNFQVGDFLFLILEYVSNGNMNDLITTREKLKKPFEEEELWEIFLQCIMGLNHIHKKGLIHRDIKPTNIFIDENMKIKIGDFGLSALDPDKYNKKNIKYLKGSYIFEDIDKLLCHNTNLGTPAYKAKEIELNKYDQKIDVYSMGCSFHEMAYFQHYDQDYPVNLENYNYSQNLKNLINSMIEEDKQKRLTSEQIYDKIEKEFSRITRNSSINAMITCLNTLKDLNEDLKSNIEQYKDKPIIKIYLECIDYLEDNEEINLNNWELKVNNFRKQLGLENLKLEGKKEIESNYLFEYIIKNLFEETKSIIFIDPNYKNGPHLINTEEGIQQTEEGEARLKFDKFSEKIKSPIIQHLKGLMKQTNICNECKVKTYSFSSYFYVNFNLKQILEKKKFNILDLEEIFKLNNTFNDNFFCSKCFQKTNHNCTKEFYSFPNILIIYIQRGIASINKMEVNIKKNIEFKNIEKQTSKKYNLVGLINKTDKDNNEYYISNFYNNNKWLRSERYKNMRSIEPPFESYAKLKKNGNVVDEDTVMLFYTSN